LFSPPEQQCLLYPTYRASTVIPYTTLQDATPNHIIRLIVYIALDRVSCVECTSYECSRGRGQAEELSTTCAGEIVHLIISNLDSEIAVDIVLTDIGESFYSLRLLLG
jgi:hypothetical protein